MLRSDRRRNCRQDRTSQRRMGKTVEEGLKAMSSRFESGLIFIVICLAASSAFAQQQRRDKPSPKAAGVEAKDPLKQAAELFEAGQNAHQKGELEKAVGLYAEALERDPSL